jgi:hypothetical protein
VGDRYITGYSMGWGSMSEQNKIALKRLLLPFHYSRLSKLDQYLDSDHGDETLLEGQRN